MGPFKMAPLSTATVQDAKRLQIGLTHLVVFPERLGKITHQHRVRLSVAT